jgi:hypothetical protein
MSGQSRVGTTACGDGRMWGQPPPAVRRAKLDAFDFPYNGRTAGEYLGISIRVCLQAYRVTSKINRAFRRWQARHKHLVVFKRLYRIPASST